MGKLRKESERIKEILSANKEFKVSARISALAGRKLC